MSVFPSLHNSVYAQTNTKSLQRLQTNKECIQVAENVGVSSLINCVYMALIKNENETWEMKNENIAKQQWERGRGADWDIPLTKMR